MQGTEFCLLAERGPLELQAVLLCESIRKYCGRYASAEITVISPRAGRRPSSHSRRRFMELGAEYKEVSLQSPTPEYGPSFRVMALAWRARQDGPKILVQLDTDTIFLDEPDLDLSSHGAAARPVDVIGMCSTGPGTPRESLWEDMCRANGVEIDALPFVHTTIGNHRVRASYNAGLFVAYRHAYLQIERCFYNIIASDLRPFRGAVEGIRTGAEIVTARGFEMWGTSQAAISIAAAKSGLSVRMLDKSHNIPLHLIEDLETLPERTVHVHYHWLFADRLHAEPILSERLPLTIAQKVWLGERLPFPSPKAVHEVQ